jgi:hypothetical protein
MIKLDLRREVKPKIVRIKHHKVNKCNVKSEKSKEHEDEQG